MSGLNMILLLLPLSVWAQEEQNIGPVSLNATLKKDSSVISSSPSSSYYIINLPATFHFIDRPDLNYTLSEPNDLRLQIDEGRFSINGNFKIEEENATSISTEFMKIFTSTTSFDSQNYDKRSGITTYNIDNTMNSVVPNLYIDDMSWNDVKYVLKTFDNGTGVFSLYAE
jgi:hypothetical protein